MWLTVQGFTKSVPTLIHGRPGPPYLREAESFWERSLGRTHCQPEFLSNTKFTVTRDLTCAKWDTDRVVGTAHPTRLHAANPIPTSSQVTWPIASGGSDVQGDPNPRARYILGDDHG